MVQCFGLRQRKTRAAHSGGLGKKAHGGGLYGLQRFVQIPYFVRFSCAEAAAHMPRHQFRPLRAAFIGSLKARVPASKPRLIVRSTRNTLAVLP